MNTDFQRKKNKSEYHSQTQYQNQKKLKTLFYVKSKNTNKYFKNHPYFLTSTQLNPANQAAQKSKYSQRKKSIINQQRLKTETNISTYKGYSSEKNRQFVDCPTNYGLQNTYQYLHDKSFLRDSEIQFRNLSSKRNKSFLRATRRRYSIAYTKTQANHQESQSPQKNYMKNTAAYQSKFYDVINKQNEKEQILKNNVKTQPNEVEPNLRKQSMFRVSQSRHNLSKSKIIVKNHVTQSKSLHESNLQARNIIYNVSVIKNERTFPAKCQVCFVYGKRMKSLAQIPYRQIYFDILPFIINTFLKCKIHYKQMSQSQFEFIKDSVIKVLESKKSIQKYDIKDIINIGAIKGVINFLDQFKNKENEYEWIETVKYFFVTKEQKILQYQLNKIKQQLAKLISIKFDIQFGQKQLFIFNIQTNSQANTLYDILKSSRFLIGDDANVINQYRAAQNTQFQRNSLQNKIKKWKSIASCEDNQIQNNLQKSDHPNNFKQKSLSNKVKVATGTLELRKNKIWPQGRLSEQKFNNLFEQFKIRQKKRVCKNIVTCNKNEINTNEVIIKNNNAFVQKIKLKKYEQIFE